MADQRLIDANALLKWLDEIIDLKEWLLNKYNADWIWSVIDSAPTVDAVPVVHGRWEPHPRHPGFDRCSECRDCIIGNDWAGGEKWNYCPHCGAKMDGERRAGE